MLNFCKNITLSMLTFVLIFASLEALLLIHFHYIKNPSPAFLMDDSKLGFKPTTLDILNDQYKITIDENGFREFGDINSNRTKILVIGDSFTHATHVSNNETYYHHLKKDYEVFSFGSEGYGSFQEYLILKEFLNKIKPQVIILQTSPNDLVDNTFEVYSKYKPIDSFLNRPFLIESKTRYLFDLDKSYASLRTLRSKSTLFNFVYTKYQIVRKGILHLNFDSQTPKEVDLTKQRTQEIFLKISNLVKHKSKVFVFGAYGNIKQDNDLKKISENVGLEYISQVGHDLRKAKSKGINIYAKDQAHWNKKGHSIVSKSLLVVLKNKKAYKQKN